MTADFEVRGLGELEDLGRALKAMGDGGKGLRRELFKGLNSVSKEARGELEEVIPAVLPQRGGLAGEVQRQARFSATASTSGRRLGVQIRGKARKRDMRLLTGKRLRHPVFGNRDVWVSQTEGVQPSIFLAKWEDQKPEVREAVLGVIADVRAKIYRRV